MYCTLIYTVLCASLVAAIPLWREELTFLASQKPEWTSDFCSNLSESLDSHDSYSNAVIKAISKTLTSKCSNTAAEESHWTDTMCNLFNEEKDVVALLSQDTINDLSEMETLAQVCPTLRDQYLPQNKREGAVLYRARRFKSRMAMARAMQQASKKRTEND